jgi:hypothetical protein
MKRNTVLRRVGRMEGEIHWLKTAHKIRLSPYFSAAIIAINDG